MNEKRIENLIKELYFKLKNEQFVIDKSGVKMIECVDYTIQQLDPERSILDFNVRKTNEEYCQQELSWYLSTSLNIKDGVEDIKIWNLVSDDNGYINSNYGWCCFASENYNQYFSCLETLKTHKESRQAIMIYNRPSMHIDHCKNNMSDFMCCMFNQFIIRNNKLISLVKFRSQDFIYGFFNDFYFKCYVYMKLYSDLLEFYPQLEIGYIDWNAGSLHVYERHFDLLKSMYKEII